MANSCRAITSTYAGILDLSPSHRSIIQELAAHNIRICPSEIAYLQKRFIVYLATAHKQSAVQIREVIKARGGYILHLDGTCEGDSPHLMSGLDELSHIVFLKLTLIQYVRS